MGGKHRAPARTIRQELVLALPPMHVPTRSVPVVAGILTAASPITTTGPLPVVHETAVVGIVAAPPVSVRLPLPHELPEPPTRERLREQIDEIVETVERSAYVAETVEPVEIAAPEIAATPEIVASSSLGQAVVDAAATQLGVPYVYGGNSPGSALDCSALTQYAYGAIGIPIPRTTWDQINVGRAVSLDALQIGDLVFSNGGGHVSIYAGKGQVIEAQGAGTNVMYSAIPADAYTARRLV